MKTVRPSSAGKKRPSTKAQELEARKQEILAKYKIPAEILGRKTPGPKPKVTQAKIEKVMFKFIETMEHKKLHAYQKEMLRAIWKAYPEMPVFISGEPSGTDLPSVVIKRKPSRKR